MPEGKYKVHFFAGDYRGILCDTEDEAQEKVPAAMALVRVQTVDALLEGVLG